MAELGTLLWLSVLAVAVAFLPGAVCVRLLGLRGLSMWAVAPAWTAGLTTAASLAFSFLSIRWSPVSFAVFFAVSVVLCGALGLLVLGRERVVHGAFAGHVYVRMSRRDKVLLTAFIVVAALLMWVPITFASGLDLPPQQNDPIYHMSAAQGILNTGDASPLTAFRSMYGLGRAAAIYPAVWHQLTALIATPSTVVLASKAVLLAVCLIWLVTMASLAQVGLPRLWGAPFYVVGLASILPVFPVYFLVTTARWPNALGLAIVPGLIAFALTFFRAIRRPEDDPSHHVRVLIIQGLLLVLAVAGATAAYPATFFALTVTLSAGVLVGNARVWFTSWTFKQKIVRSSAIVIGLLAVLIVPLMNTSISNMLEYSQSVDWHNPIFKLWSAVSFFPRGGGGIVLKLVLLVMGAAILLGVVLAWRAGYLRWLSVSWAILTLLLLSTMFPLGIISMYASVFYASTYRVMPILAIPCLLLAALTVHLVVTGRVGDGKLSRAVRRRVQFSPKKPVIVATCVLMLLGAGLHAPNRVADAHTLYEPGPDDLYDLADASELAMIKRVPAEVEPGYKVLGEPSNGSVLLYPMENVPVVYKQLEYWSVSQPDEENMYLANNFWRIHTDPRVCHILKKYKIRYFYSDKMRRFPVPSQLRRGPGMYNVDLSKGFTLLDEGGSAKFWQIDACGRW